MSHAEIRIRAKESNLFPVMEFITEFFKTNDVVKDALLEMLMIFEKLMHQIVDINKLSSFDGDLTISLENSQSILGITINNHAFPVFEEDLKVPDSILKVNFYDFGRKGQSIEFILKKEESPIENLKPIEELHFGQQSAIRNLLPSEAIHITKLFYNVYQYKYINETVYNHNKLSEMIASGRLKAVAAFSDEKNLIGHIGLLKWNDHPPVYEAAMGIVDPRYKGSGLFSKLFSQVHHEIRNTPMNYCVYDFVTNHDISQRQVAKFGYCDMALFLGNQVAATQASLKDLGIGTDSEEMRRYSLLVGIGPQVSHPFGKSVILPANIGEVCGFLLAPLGMHWIPASRFSALAADGEYQIQFLEEQKAAIFDLIVPGKEALLFIIERWKVLLREGIQYFAVDVPLNYPGLGTVYDFLAQHGFFFAGFIPYHLSDQIGFRFQFLLPTNVDFDGIKVYSEMGKRLLKVVKENYERNTIL